MARRSSSRRWSQTPSSPSSSSSSFACPVGGKQSNRKTKSDTPQNNKGQAASLVGCLLLPQFPVWAARFTNPALNATPLLIHHKGKVMSACRHSLAAGVRIGWTLQRAQSLCPSAAVRAAAPCEVAYAWSEILAVLYGLTPRLEPTRPGLLFFEPPSPGSSAWLSTMAALAKLVKGWYAQVALAPDRATAELAAHTVASGMIRRITNGTNFLQQTPSTLLMDLGLSPATTERLQWFGFKRVADLRVLSREQIASQFADVTTKRDAAQLWRFARAGTPQGDLQPVQSYHLPPSCKTRMVFEQAATCPTQWQQGLTDIVQQAAAQLNGLQVGVLSLQIETQHGHRLTSKILREPLSSARSLFRIAWDEALAALKPGDEVQAVEVLLSQLMADGQQDTLFDARAFDRSSARPCPRTLLSALRNLEARHAGTMWQWRLRDAFAPLSEERFVLRPAVGDDSPALE